MGTNMVSLKLCTNTPIKNTYDRRKEDSKDSIEICLTFGSFVSRYYNATFTVFCSIQNRRAPKSSEICFGGDFLESLLLPVDWEK